MKRLIKFKNSNSKYKNVFTPGSEKLTNFNLLSDNDLSLDALDDIDFNDNIISADKAIQVPEYSNGYVDPKKYGIHHIALLYDTYAKDKEALDYYFGKKDYLTNNIDYSYQMFDTILPLAFHINDTQTDYGDIYKEDLVSYLGQLGSKDSFLITLNQCAKESGKSRNIIIMQPWMNPNLGNREGGLVFDYTTVQGRYDITTWYISEVEKIFSKLNLDYLNLWGFYRMREDVLAKEIPLVQGESKAIHDAGYYHLFIPYYMAQGWDKRNDMGFDVTLMQPSYAFRSYLDGGVVNASRVQSTDRLAKDNGMGVELEFRGSTRLTSERYITAQYMSGISQQGIVGYFLGDGLDKLEHNTYNAIAEYIEGHPIKSPDGSLLLKSNDNLIYKQDHVNLSLYRAIRIDLFETVDNYWSGNVDLYVNDQFYSWLSIGNIDSLQPKIQGYFVPLEDGNHLTDVSIKLAFTPYDGKSIPNIKEIVLDASASAYTHNELIGSRVEITNQGVDTSNYNDVQYTGTISNGKLNDGNLAGIDWYYYRSQLVGWNSNPGEFAVSFDFGKEVDITKFRLYSVQDTTSGINWPLNPELLITNSPQIAVRSGLGSRLVSRSIGITNNDRHILATDGDYKNWGYLENNTHFRTRYLTLWSSTNSWSMLSEVQFYKGDNLIPYDYQILRHTGNLSLYQDNGIRLVDGEYNDGYASGAMTALQNKYHNTIELTLRSPKLLSKLVIYAVDDYNFGIGIPKNLSMKVYDETGKYQFYNYLLTLYHFGRKGIKLESKLPNFPIKKIVLTDLGNMSWHSFTEIKAV